MGKRRKKYAFTPAEAVERWYGDCLGQPKEVPGSPLAYEPRAAWGCVLCHSVLIGTKSGHLYIVKRDPANVSNARVEPVRKFGDSIQAVNGCLNPDCKRNKPNRSKKRTEHLAGAVVGTNDGYIHYLESISADPVPYSLNGGVSAMAVRILRDAAGRLWSFVAPNSRSIQVVPLHAGSTAVVHDLPRSVRAVLALAGPRTEEEPRDPRRDRRWLLVSTDGHVSSARVMWKDGAQKAPTIGVIEIGRLRHAPSCIAADRPGGTVRSIVYGSENGLHVAIIDRDGITRERDLRRGVAIRYARVVHIFNVPFLLATTAGGQVWTRRWEHPEDTGEGGWLRWPDLSSDVMFVDVTRDKARDPSVSHALLLLRTHEVFRMRLFNIEDTLTCLRVTQPWRDIDPTGGGENSSDALRFAEIRCSSDPIPFERFTSLVNRGGQKTLEAAIAHLAEAPGLDYRQLLELSVDIVIAGGEQGTTAARELARQLHRSLTVLLRDSPLPAPGAAGRVELADREALGRWVLFLRKYFVMAHTFSEKRLSLETLVSINANRKSADAFIYSSRLASDGFDVQWERRIHSPVLALATVDTAAAVERVGLSFADGRIGLLIDLADPKKCSLEFVREPADIEPGAQGGPFRNYSRVLHPLADQPAGRRWFAAFRHPVARPEEDLVMPPVDDSTDALQVYSTLELPGRQLLLGLRDLRQPLARFSLETGELKPVSATWGTERHLQSRFSGGERRVWAITWLDREHTTLAAGAEDGYLRFGRLTDDGFKLQHLGQGHAEYLGGAVRALLAFEEEGRRFLVAGTQQAQLFCFEVGPGSQDGPTTVLKFRDLLRSSIVSLFVTEIERGNPQLCVVEESGRLTTFDVRKHAEQDGFLGRRTGHYSICDGATGAVPLGSGLVLMAGWSGTERSGWLRVVSFRSESGLPFRHAPYDRVRSTALTAVANVIVANRRSSDTLPLGPVEHERVLRLLASMPFKDSGVRAMVVRPRVALASVGSGRLAQLKRLRDEAIRFYPDDRDELKLLLDELVNQLTNSLDELSLFEDLCELFIDPRRLGSPLEKRDARLQAAVVRRVLSAEMLRLWFKRSVPEAEATREEMRRLWFKRKVPEAEATPEEHRRLWLENKLQNWVERHLQHDEAFVRVDTLRTLSEVLHSLVQLKNGPRAGIVGEVFTGQPPVTSAVWLLDALARFLYSHPPTQRGAECDASTWAAVSVLVNLVRLFPDSVMVICDHLAVNRVDPLVFSVLERRLTNKTHDGPILKRLKLYLPWLDVPPVNELWTHCSPFKAGVADGLAKIKSQLSIGDAEPDHAYVEAYAACYHWFGLMSRASSTKDLLDLHERVGEFSVPESPQWVKLLWPERERFMQFAEAWIRDTLADDLRLLNPANSTVEKDVTKLATDQLARILRERHAALEAEAGVTSARSADGAQVDQQTTPKALFQPELGVARRIVSEWLRMLSQDLPRRLDPIGGGRILGAPVAGGTYVFEIDDSPGELAALSVVRDGDLANALKIWNTIKDFSNRPRSRIVPITEVFAHGSMPAMIMKRVGGRDLRTAWGDLIGQDDGKRAATVRACLIDTTQALIDLHKADLYHGDIQPANIMWTDEDRFVLVDFDKSGDAKRLDSPSYFWGGSHVDEGVFKERPPGVLGWQQNDCIALANLCVQALQAREWSPTAQASFDPDGFPVYLKTWLWRFHERWVSGRNSGWSAPSLRREATGDAREVFVSGTTSDTKAIRELLYAKARNLEEWHVQGHWPEEPGRRTFDHVYELIERSKAVVLLLGRSAGTPAIDVPTDYRDKAAELGYLAPTYTVCEYLIAKSIGKDIRCFNVETNGTPENLGPNDPGLDMLRRKIDSSKPPTIDEHNCVDVVLAALRRI